MKTARENLQTLTAERRESNNININTSAKDELISPSNESLDVFIDKDDQAKEEKSAGEKIILWRKLI